MTQQEMMNQRMYWKVHTKTTQWTVEIHPQNHPRKSNNNMISTKRKNNRST